MCTSKTALSAKSQDLFEALERSLFISPLSLFLPPPTYLYIFHIHLSIYLSIYLSGYLQPYHFRLGDTDTCQKYFGRQRPNCAKYGATLYTRRVGSSLVLYWCHKAMSTGSASQGNQSSNGGVTRPSHLISRPGGAQAVP